jgi:DNA-binding NtrC family response regulator
MDGRPTCEDCRCLWPIDSPSQHGLIYLEGPDPLSVPLVRQAITELGPLFCTALEIKDMPTSVEAAAIVDDYLQATPTEAVRRRQLTTLLNHNEWNLSRVARLLGVTRVTVYNRMRKFGIERIKVPKTRG